MMPGTSHFSRINYHASRGLREIVAPRQTMSKKHWEDVIRIFENKCFYCDCEGSAENRGIVADHLIPVTNYGELVLGNTVPACQTCNDSKGNQCWHTYVNNKHGEHSLAATDKISKIEKYIEDYKYQPVTPRMIFSKNEFKQYSQLLVDIEKLLKKAKTLKEKAKIKRKMVKIIG